MHTAGKKVVRALYKYEPSVITNGTDADHDLPFNKGDHMIIIREYVCQSVCLSICPSVTTHIYTAGRLLLPNMTQSACVGY